MIYSIFQFKNLFKNIKSKGKIMPKKSIKTKLNIGDGVLLKKEKEYV